MTIFCPDTGLPLPEALSNPSPSARTPAVGVLYHKSDEMIPYRFASLAAALDGVGVCFEK